jgi:hypothetical protein
MNGVVLGLNNKHITDGQAGKPRCSRQTARIGSVEKTSIAVRSEPSVCCHEETELFPLIRSVFAAIK